jgi:hypothetical protein
MEKIKPLLLLCVLCIGIQACKKEKKPNPVVVKPTPLATLLSAPANGQPCLTGVSISATQSTVTFSWNKAENTETYELRIKNLATGDSVSVIKSTTQLTADVALLKSTPYSWYVVSKASGVTTAPHSDTWKFYNSGPGLSVYPPYPADLVSPAWGELIANQSGTLVLNWVVIPGSSPVKYYDVYLGNTLAPFLYKSNVTDSQLQIAVAANTQYFWRIVAKDANGNSSVSQVGNFYVK